jgi:biopolymer transport protein ExbD
MSAPLVSRPAALHAELNVTPLVDVMLVLLILFMIAAPMLQSSIGLQLPAVRPVAADPPAAPVRLGLDARGQVSHDGHALDRGQLDYLMRTTARAQPAALVQISADDGVRYQAVAEVMASARRAGVQQIALAGAGPR